MSQKVEIRNVMGTSESPLLCTIRPNRVSWRDFSADNKILGHRYFLRFLGLSRATWRNSNNYRCFQAITWRVALTAANDKQQFSQSRSSLRIFFFNLNFALKLWFSQDMSILYSKGDVYIFIIITTSAVYAWDESALYSVSQGKTYRFFFFLPKK